MNIFTKSLEDLNEKDLLRLIDSEFNEGKTIDYKRNLQLGNPKDKIEFLADVSSFANSNGGNLIYGITEKAGKPIELLGMDSENPDSLILTLENLIRDKVRPRIIGVHIRSISLKNKKMALVVRIPRSWNSPHMVTYDDEFRFFARNSNGKQRMDVDELRIAFNLSESATERIRDFRAERLSRIVSGETPFAMKHTSKLILHIIPLGAFRNLNQVDVSRVHSGQISARPLCINNSHFIQRYNLDGYLAGSGDPRQSEESAKSYCSYILLFRNGVIEAVDTHLLNCNKDRIIRSLIFENSIVEFVKKQFPVLKVLETEPPFVVLLTLMGVNGFSLLFDEQLQKCMSQGNGSNFDKDTLMLPEVITESFDEDPQKLLKPIFDSLWNAAGWSRCLHYNEKGERVGQ
jgi:hypothetical protein